MAAFHRLTPEKIAECIKEMPIAYVPIGILEWHGLHNPYGLDGLKANGIALHLASELGGLVMPTMYWGDNRSEICERHLDVQMSAGDSENPDPYWNPADLMCSALGVERDVFAKDAERSIRQGGWRLWEEMAVHIFFQTETYGFQFIVAFPGHYPLFEPLNHAITRYYNEGGKCRIMVFNDALFSENGRGDHAASYETSLMMALEPDLVKLDRLDPDLSKPLAGVVMGKDPRVHANARHGEEALSKMVAYMKVQFANEGYA